MKKQNNEEEMEDFSHYLVTGRLYNSNKRFNFTTTSLIMAMGTNLWNGSIWRVTKRGKRKLIKRVIN